jgi:hypothetical protein
MKRNSVRAKVACIGKGSTRFPDTNGRGYAEFTSDAASASASSRIARRVDGRTRGADGASNKT